MPEIQIKICGLSTPETVDAAIASGATHIGLNLYPPSPRYVTLEQAAALRARIPHAVKVVLLLVNGQLQEIEHALRAVRPDAVQFHGDETPEELSRIKQNAALEVWKAAGVADTAGLERAQRFKGAADLLLYDAPAKALPGGNGLAMDWSLLSGFRHTMPWGLAGGLSAGNVAGAIRQTGAPLVDTSSGVESAPGVKDVDRIKAFCQAARGL
jgi:phosphoribosylanthranilate isomerase